MNWNQASKLKGGAFFQVSSEGRAHSRWLTKTTDLMESKCLVKSNNNRKSGMIAAMIYLLETR